MTPEQIAEVRSRLVEFTAQMIDGAVGRSDQRDKGEVYVRGLGIDHFEGRSLTGWHRHVTLTILAQAFCTLLRADPKAAAPA